MHESSIGPWRAALVVALCLTGCYVPTPSTHVHLQVTEAGVYALEGAPVAAGDLAARLREMKTRSPRLVVEIRSTPAVPQAAINTAVRAATAAHATVAFAQASSAP